MKRFTRMIAFFMLTVFVLAPITHATTSTYYYTSGNVEVKITHPGLDEEKLLHIAQTLASGKTNSETQTYGLTCTLFGHKLVTTTNEVITHMVYDTYPHCKRECYSVSICERCDYTETELVSTETVGCCVE